MRKSEKTFVVDELKERIKDAKSFIALDYQGLPVREITKLREMIKDAGGTFVVVKNTLLKLAFSGSDKGKETRQRRGSPRAASDKLVEYLQGPTAVVFWENDEVAPLQAIGKFMKELNLPKLKFGIFGQDVYEQDTLLKLAYLPSRNALFGQLLFVLQSPVYAFIRTLQWNTDAFISMLQKSKGGDA